MSRPSAPCRAQGRRRCGRNLHASSGDDVGRPALLAFVDAGGPERDDRRVAEILSLEAHRLSGTRRTQCVREDALAVHARQSAGRKGDQFVQERPVGGRDAFQRLKPSGSRRREPAAGNVNERSNLFCRRRFWKLHRLHRDPMEGRRVIGPGDRIPAREASRAIYVKRCGKMRSTSIALKGLSVPTRAASGSSGIVQSEYAHVLDVAGNSRDHSEPEHFIARSGARDAD